MWEVIITYASGYIHVESSYLYVTDCEMGYARDEQQRTVLVVRRAPPIAPLGLPLPR